MAMQFSTTVRNAALDAMEAAIGTAPILRIYDLTASAPADCVAAITATLLVEMTLPSDWKGAASGGTKALAGTWQDTSANGTGTADFFRIWDSAGSVCHEQGTVTATGGGGDMTLDSVSVTEGQQVSITSHTWTAGGG